MLARPSKPLEYWSNHASHSPTKRSRIHQLRRIPSNRDIRVMPQDAIYSFASGRIPTELCFTGLLGLLPNPSFSGNAPWKIIQISSSGVTRNRVLDRNCSTVLHRTSKLQGSRGWAWECSDSRVSAASLGIIRKLCTELEVRLDVLQHGVSWEGNIRPQHGVIPNQSGIVSE